jgi:uncharacterized protein (TIGR02246 family)
MTRTPLAVVEDLDDALERGDIESALDAYADNAVLVITASRVAYGKRDIRKFFDELLRLKPRVRQLKTHTIESDDTALFISEWSCSGSYEHGEPFSRQAIATCVFRKDASGNWRLLIDNALGPAILESKENE